VEKFWCGIEEKFFRKGPCLYQRGGTTKENKTCPECAYYIQVISPPKKSEPPKRPPRKSKKEIPEVREHASTPFSSDQKVELPMDEKGRKMLLKAFKTFPKILAMINGKDTIVLKVKPGIAFPGNVQELLTAAINLGDTHEAAKLIRHISERNEPLSRQNMWLQAKILEEGKVKERRGPTQKQGFSDLLIWIHYKLLVMKKGTPVSPALRAPGEEHGR
jgi:hypothetical protein